MALPEELNRLQAPGQYGGINPQATPAAPVTSKLPSTGTPGQSGQYGGINPQGQPPPISTTPAKPPVISTPGGATPGPAAPAPAGASQPWYGQQDVTNFQSWAQNRYGRQATPDELARIGGNSTDMASAQSYADTLARQQGWTGGGTTPGAPAPGTPATPNPVDAQLQTRLMELLQTNTGDVNTGSQEYQSQLGSFKRSQGKAMEQAKNAAAERAAGGGTLGSGGFDAAQGTIDLAGAQGVGDFEAQLAGQQLSRQREDLSQGLQLAQQSGLAREARDLQERLSGVDANLRQQGINLQGELGRGDLDLRRLLGTGQLDLSRQQLGLGRDQLGFNYAQLGQQADQSALQQLLAGL